MSEKHDAAAAIIINSATKKGEFRSGDNDKRYLYFFPKSQEDVDKLIEAIKSAGVKNAEEHTSSAWHVPVVRVPSLHSDIEVMTRSSSEINLQQLNFAIADAVVKECSKVKEEMNNRDIDVLSNFYINKINETYYLSMNDEHINSLDVALNVLKKYGLKPQQTGHRYKIFAPTIKTAAVLDEIVKVSQTKYQEKERIKAMEIARQSEVIRPTANKANTEQQKTNGLFARIKAAFQRN